MRHVESASWEPARELFDGFVSELDHHVRLKEEIIFPLFEERTGMRNGPTRMMSQ